MWSQFKFGEENLRLLVYGPGLMSGCVLVGIPGSVLRLQKNKTKNPKKTCFSPIV